MLFKIYVQYSHAKKEVGFLDQENKNILFFDDEGEVIDAIDATEELGAIMCIIKYGGMVIVPLERRKTGYYGTWDRLIIST